MVIPRALPWCPDSGGFKVSDVGCALIEPDKVAGVRRRPALQRSGLAETAR
ncbi:hypothetical protein ABGB18_47320 [Nonomuraea sp. B12E4]|uniref:hypothetical protein n=1 Tax=Nonomuraea sp. B12E4 TaxID=3153564 RepID=UPI00325CEF51